MSGWLTAALALVGAVLGSAGAVAIVKAVARRKVTAVEATERLTETTLKWVEELKADAAEARKEAAEARREAADARREMANVRREAEQLVQDVRREAELLAQDLHRMRAAILDPLATLETLRALAGHGPGNGTPKRMP